MRNFFISFAFILSFTDLLCAQELFNYIPVSDDPAQRSKILKSLEERFKKDESSINNNFKKETKAQYKDRYDFLVEQVNKGNFYLDDTINTYFQGIFSKLKLHIPEANIPDLRLLVSRDVIPNAYSTGEGTLVFMIGLLRYLDNEDQLAFILCHELAHFLKDHSNIKLHKSLSTLYSSSTKEELKKIKQEEFGQTQKALNLLKGLAFNYSRHSREYEKEADSLGFVLFSKTPYNIHEAVTALALLDTVDKEKYNFPLYIDQTFNFSEYPFKKSWLGKQSTLLINKLDTLTKAEEDSLKTHPDCQIRIMYIEPMLEGTTTMTNYSDSSLFNRIKLYSEFEIIQNEYDQKNLGDCFFHTLQLLKLHPNNAYLHGMIGLCLNTIHDALGTYTVNNYLSLPRPRMKDDLKMVYEFLNNMRSADLKNISYYYLKKHFEAGKINDLFVYQYWLACKNMGKTSEMQEVASYYQKYFPNGKHKLNTH